MNPGLSEKGASLKCRKKDAAPAAVLCWRTCPNPCLLVCCTVCLLHPLLSTLSISLVLFPPEGFWAEGKVKVWDLSTCGSFHLVATGTLLHWCHILSSFSSLWFSGPFELSLHLLAGWGKLNNTQECKLSGLQHVENWKLFHAVNSVEKNKFVTGFLFSCFPKYKKTPRKYLFHLRAPCVLLLSADWGWHWESYTRC